MFKILKNGRIYSPKDIGIKDILVINDTIISVENNISIKNGNIPLEVYDVSGMMVFPGIIDPHIHLIGAGGSGGLNSRTKEISAQQIIEAGVTTVVGCLGFDKVSRNLKTLLIKTKALEELGLTAYMITGSFSLPSLTFTGSVEEDLVLIDKIIGVKVALGENLGNWPDIKDIKNLLSECIRGGHLSGKSGFLQIHLGQNGKLWKKIFMEIFEETKIPYSQVVFTHVNRSGDVFEEFMDYVKAGGYVDLTASLTPSERPGSLTVLESIKRLIREGISLDRVSISSDSNASRILPDKSLKYMPTKIIFDVTKELCQSGEIPIEKAVSLVTKNPANAIGLSKIKGSLEEGKHADLMILNDKFELESVMIKGKWAMKNKTTLIKEDF